MLKTMSRMASIGRSNAALYQEASRRVADDRELKRFLMSLARSERAAVRALRDSAARIDGSGRRLSAASPELNEAMEQVGSGLPFLREAAASCRPQDFLEGLVACEQVRWNRLVVELASGLRQGFPEIFPFLSAAQRHKRTIERFIKQKPGLGRMHFRLRASEPVWTERLLVVGDLAPALVDGLRDEGEIDVAGHGREAVEMLRERYYAAVLTDAELEHMDGIEVCRAAARIFPGVEDRFLFLYKALSRRQKEFIERRKLRRIKRQAQAEQVWAEVARILEG